MGILKSVNIGIVAAVALTVASTSAQAVFLPVIDEFSVTRNGAAVYTDSFNDGVLPPSDSNYATGGAAGFVNETAGTPAQGKLTMNPALGDGVLIPGHQAELFTGAVYRTSVGGGADALNQASSFSVHGLFDLANSPEALGDAMGIRLSDRVGGTGPFAQPGNDIMQLSVRYGLSGDLVITLALLEDITDTITTLDITTFDTFAGLTPTQIELVLSKEAGLATIGASFVVFDQFGNSMQSETLFAGTSELIPIFNGEDFTRAQFFSTTSVFVPAPEPGIALIFGLGLAGLGYARRKRAA